MSTVLRTTLQPHAFPAFVETEPSLSGLAERHLRVKGAVYWPKKGVREATGEVRASGRQYGSYPETGSEEIDGGFLEAGFWPGIHSGWYSRRHPRTSGHRLEE